MGRHNNDIPALFTVTHSYIRNPNTKYFKGRILAGQQTGKPFIAIYEKIPQECDVESDNSEDEICLCDCDGGYVRISVGFYERTTEEDVVFEEVQNMPNGDFRYAVYMSHVAYIVMTGMILTGI